MTHRPTYERPQRPHGTDDRLLTIDEAAVLLCTPTATLRYWRHIGTGPYSFRPARRVLYWLSDVLDWIDTNYDNSRQRA